MGTQYLIMPEESSKIMADGGETKDIKKYWTHAYIDSVIIDNFEFSNDSWYNIYILTDEGWRTVNKYAKKGAILNDAEKHILNFIIDSNANQMGMSAQKVYAIEIEEIGKKKDVSLFKH